MNTTDQEIRGLAASGMPIEKIAKKYGYTIPQLEKHLKKLEDAANERIKAMKTLRFDRGMTLQEIGEIYGITRERVRQLTGSSEGKHNRSQRVTREEEERQNARYEFAAAHPEMTTEELGKALGLRPQTADMYWKGRRHRRQGESPNVRGHQIEDYVSQMLTQLGIKHTLTNSRPYDIILDDGRTVEIKSRWAPEKNRSSENFYFFPMSAERAGKPLADFYIFCIVRENRIYPFVVPSVELPEKKAFGFVWPTDRYPRCAIPYFYNHFELLDGKHVN